MLAFFSHLLGEDPRYTMRFQPSGRRRILMMGSALLVPVLLWWVSTYLLVYQVMQEPWWIALLAACTTASLIFLIERSIVMSPSRHWVMVCFRLLLGFLVAILGSLSIDEVIFKHDIDTRVASLRMEAGKNAVLQVEEAYQPRLADQKRKVEALHSVWQKALEEVRREADGTGGSGIAKVGAITIVKQDQARLLEKDYLVEKDRQDALVNAMKEEMARAESSALSEFRENGILLRAKALFQLVGEEVFVLLAYLLMTLLLFCLEFIVIIFKLTLPPTTDERLELMAEELIHDKAQRTSEKIRMYHNGVRDLPQVRQAEGFSSRRMAGVL